MSKQVKTTCPYCGVGCGVLAELDESGRVTIVGDPEHPSNHGRLCSKGAALADTISYDGRLLYPEINGETENWSNATNHVAMKLKDTIAQYGADSVAFYVSGQLLTEDYYVANKLMKGFIGSNNIDTNSRLCMSSAVAGYKRAFGSDSVPCAYEDLERAKLVILAGSNAAWCHPVLFQRIKQAKLNNPDLFIVVIDPRQTASCTIADMHLAIAPGTDNILFNGLLVYLNDHDEVNQQFIKQCTNGLDKAINAAQKHAASVEVVSGLCGLANSMVSDFYRLFSRTERVVTVFSQGINQWSYGTDRVNAIINCHLITGRIGRPGMGPFSFTGQPNAMGGREVGGLSNQLAAHMAIENETHRELVQEFWQSPLISDKQGLKAVELFEAVHDGRIKILWIIATNPAVSMPNADFVREALSKCEFLIVSDCMRNTDTTQYADVLLPSQTWGERDGTVTNSERRISRQRQFLPIPGQAKPDWKILAQVAQNMGFNEGFNYSDSLAIFKEHAALSGYKNNGSRDFDISYFEKISAEDFWSIKPVQWPVTAQHSDGTTRLFSDGQFFTENKRANFIPVLNHQPANSCCDEFPLVLNSGRIRDQWHTMTRTGKSATLSAHTVEPYVEIHFDDAKTGSIEDGELVMVTSQWGTIVVRAVITQTQRLGSVFIPMHWNDQFSSKSYCGALINPNVDPISGQPEFKHTPVSITRYQPSWYGFLLSRRKLTVHNSSYWAATRGRGLWRYEIAGQDKPEDWAACARSLLCQHADQVEWVEYFDSAATRYRGARIENGHLESCIFIGPDFNLPERDWLSNLFTKDKLSDVERHSVLTGKPARGQKDAGKIICACFNVGVNSIIDAINNNNIKTVDEIGKLLKAGSNCGSCVPELSSLLNK
ncbi:Assimilatory nitrate reductase large subunit [hydrothermal vent metagenome]|uniref:Assimilatory nitrate reductase large subunit n=1 Tax=hydrothermal vent metagenome TaxID=652676 RepID=A0A3B1B4B8_9ZZZZ